MVFLLVATIGTDNSLKKNKQMETNDNSGKKGTFGQFILLFVGFIVALVAISYFVTSLMK
jgi:hypothetical protein